MSKTIAINLKVNGVEQSVTNLTQLEQSIEAIKTELKGTDFGSTKFKELSKDLQKAQSELKDFEKTFEGLDTAQKAESFLKVGEAIAGGFAIGQGAMAIFGAESEKLQEIQVRVQGAIAIAVGARSLAEGVLQARVAARIAQEKLYQVVQATTTLVVGGTTGALKLFRIALAATGVGLIILALGALVANFDKIKKAISGNSQAWKTFKNVLMFVAPPLFLIIKGIEFLAEKFGGLQQLIAAVGAAFIQFFSSIGNAFSLLIQGEFSAAVKAITDIPADVADAGKKAIKKVNEEIAEEARKVRVKAQVVEREREIKYLEALGKDTYKLRKKQLQDELSLLEKGSKEYLDKLNDIRILDANQRTKILADSLKQQKKELDAQIKGLERYENSIQALTDTTIPQVEATKELNEELEKQKKILKDIKSPLQEFDDSFKSVDIPTDEFGAFYEVSRNILADGVLTKTGAEFKTLRETLLQIAKDKSLGDITSEQLSVFNGLAKNLESVSGKELKVALEGLSKKGSPFSQEAYRAFQVVVEAGYGSAFAQLKNGDVVDKNSSELLEAYTRVFRNTKKSLSEIDGDGNISEVFFDYDPGAASNLEEQLKKTFKSVFNIAEKDFEKNGSLFTKFKDTLTDTILGTSELEQEIRKVFGNARDLEDQINQNLGKNTINRLRLLDSAYKDYTDRIIEYGDEYTTANEQQLRDQNLEVFNRLKKELEVFTGAQEEKDKILKKYQKNYDRTEAEITKNVESETEKRAKAEKEAFEQRFEAGLKFLDSVANAAQDIASVISDLTDVQIANLDRKFDAQFARLEEGYNEDLEQAGDNTRKKNRIEKKYTADRIALEEEYEAERRRLRKKALLAELIANTLSIVAETAKNIVKAFPNPFLMVAAGVLGLAQGAIAVAQYNSAKKLRRGGMLMAKGKRHAQGGILMPSGEEIEGGELVLPREVAMNSEALSLAGAASSMVGGTNFAQDIGRFDSMYNNSLSGRNDTVINAIVVADEVQRENVLDKKIRDRARI